MRLSALCAGCPLPPGRFLVLISVRGRVDHSAIVQLEGLGQLKIPMTWGIETRDLPACSIVLQPTSLLRAPSSEGELVIYMEDLSTELSTPIGMSSMEANTFSLLIELSVSSKIQT
jgi:hypothetical protein